MTLDMYVSLLYSSVFPSSNNVILPIDDEEREEKREADHTYIH